MVTATAREKNGEFGETVGPITKIAGILTYSWLKALAVNGAGHLADLSYASLIGFDGSQRTRASMERTLIMLKSSSFFLLLAYLPFTCYLAPILMVLLQERLGVMLGDARSCNHNFIT